MTPDNTHTQTQTHTRTHARTHTIYTGTHARARAPDRPPARTHTHVRSKNVRYSSTLRRQNYYSTVCFAYCPQDSVQLTCFYTFNPSPCPLTTPAFNVFKHKWTHLVLNGRSLLHFWTLSTLDLFPKQRLGGAHMGFSQRTDTC